MIVGARSQAEMYRISDDHFVWAARVAWLPDSIDDGDRFGIESLERGYLNFAHALATTTLENCAVQLRVNSTGRRSATGLGIMTAWVIGTAPSRDAGIRLWGLVAATLPSELPLQPCAEVEVRGVLEWINPKESPSIVEIRRRVEDTAPEPGLAPREEPSVGTILRWDPTGQPLRTAFSLLPAQTGKVTLVLHVEKATPSELLLQHLATTYQTAASSIANRSGGEYTPFLQQLTTEARLRMRVLPRGALHLRLAIAAESAISEGLAQAVGMDLTALGGFEVLKPQPGFEFEDALALFEFGQSLSWQELPLLEMEELRGIADPTEAAKIIRFPQPPRGGFGGIPSVPLLTLPRSPQTEVDSGVPSSEKICVLGESPFGGAATLTLQEINQHVLVAGLPGFGKTSTVQSILLQLWRDHRIPFLVLDPAKADYGKLVDELGEEARHIVLTPDDVAFNPFVVPENVSQRTFAARVVGAIDAALQLSNQWPGGFIMLSRAIFRAYEDCGKGEHPTLRSVYASLGDLIDRSDASERMKGEYRGSLLGRIESLVRGPLGAALTGSSNSGIDWKTLLKRPTVVEFRGFSGPTERSLIFGLIVAGLTTYREQEKRPNSPSDVGAIGESDEPHDAWEGGLRHVTVLEEAHRVLSDRGTTESEGVRLLAEAIAELRGRGEGFIVVDQAPSSLHPVVRKVSGSVIAHRLSDAEERLLIGAALLLDDRQNQDLARLPRQHAVVYGAQRSTATLVNISDVSFRAVRKQPTSNSLADGGFEAFFCVGCPTMCTERETGRAMADAASPFGITSRMLMRPSIARANPGALWCAMAHVSGDDARAVNPAWLLNELHVLRTEHSRFIKSLPEQSAHNKPFSD